MFQKITFLLFIALNMLLVTSHAQTPEIHEAISPKHQALVRIASQAAVGNLDRLKQELNKGLDAGLTINQIKDAAIHLYAYAGFPRSIRTLQTTMAVLEERRAKGIIDIEGPVASPIAQDSSKYVRGKAVLQELTGVVEPATKTGYAAFAPPIEVFLKEHLFADLFERDVLSYLERELVTISVLASIGGVEPMLRSHLTICQNLGCSPAYLQQFVGLIDASQGLQRGEEAAQVLEEVLQKK